MSSKSPPDTLGLSRRVLGILIKLNFLLGVFIVTLLVTSFVAQDFMMRALGMGTDPAHGLVVGTRLIMLIGIIAVPITHTVLARLLAIVDTVRDGDPFVALNADRLQKIAWAVLTLELLHIVVVWIADSVSTPTIPLDMGSALSITRWLAVLLLFVLARVFEQGTRMREDLEGTV